MWVWRKQGDFQDEKETKDPVNTCVSLMWWCLSESHSLPLVHRGPFWPILIKLLVAASCPAVPPSWISFLLPCLAEKPVLNLPTIPPRKLCFRNRGRCASTALSGRRCAHMCKSRTVSATCNSPRVLGVCKGSSVNQ